MRRINNQKDDWDWWGTMQWPPGPLREFDPADRDASTTHAKWRQFNSARKAAAPNGWRLECVRLMIRSAKLAHCRSH
jgi:hypothetical protein